MIRKTSKASLKHEKGDICLFQSSGAVEIWRGREREREVIVERHPGGLTLQDRRTPAVTGGDWAVTRLHSP